MVPILIAMNNYFHDVATAFMLSSGIVIFIFIGTVERDGRNDVIDYFKNNYKRYLKIIRYAGIWIVIGGIFRTIFFMKYEWLPAAGKGLIPAILLKHVLVFTFIGLGIYTWKKLFKKINNLIQEQG